jgi:nickel/cobalt transporter (NiCoT) family protein
MDTIDGCFMNLAYGWAFFNPVRKIFYNLAITGLSVAICFFIGTIEILGLLPTELHVRGAFWQFMEKFNINAAGFVIVGMFVATWVAALAIWRFARIEEKWTAKLNSGDGLPTS